MATKTIVITWMDGEQATYDDAATNVIDGILHLHTYRHGAGGTGVPVSEWHFPTANIRAWGPQPWAASHREATP